MKAATRGAVFLRVDADDRDARIRARVEQSLIGLGASYANSLTLLAAEAKARSKALAALSV